MQYDVMTVCGHPFRFVQFIEPERDAYGNVKEYWMELEPGKPVNQYGVSPFCRFGIEAENVPGVYLWVVDDEIIYIGETAEFRKRFNQGYGHIYTYNCYKHGRTTNCKMNKAALAIAKQGKQIRLYFYRTDKHKEVERELLYRINTKYNVKDNQ